MMVTDGEQCSIIVNDGKQWLMMLYDGEQWFILMDKGGLKRFTKGIYGERWVLVNDGFQPLPPYVHPTYTYFEIDT